MYIGKIGIIEMIYKIEKPNEDYRFDILDMKLEFKNIDN